MGSQGLRRPNMHFYEVSIKQKLEGTPKYGGTGQITFKTSPRCRCRSSARGLREELSKAVLAEICPALRWGPTQEVNVWGGKPSAWL